jgi:poly(hydroxyalkanoate) granule-associated protein
MAKAKTGRSKGKAKRAPVTTQSVRQAGIGALALVRRESEAALQGAFAQGRRWQRDGLRFARETAADLQAQATGWLVPLKAEVDARIERAGRVFDGAVARTLARFGIAQQAQLDQLARQVQALGRRVKAR